MPGRLGRIGRKAALAYGAGSLLGPAGAGAVLFGGAAARGGVRGAKAARGAIRSAGESGQRALSGMPQNVKDNRLMQFAARRPISAGAIAGVAGIGVAGNFYNSNASKRNQNDWYLKRVRRHQQSSALTGLAPMARSIGGMTG